MCAGAFGTDEERAARPALEGRDEPFLRMDVGGSIGLEPLCLQGGSRAGADRRDHARGADQPACELPRAVRARDDDVVVATDVDRIV